MSSKNVIRYGDPEDPGVAARADTKAEKEDVKTARQHGNYISFCAPCFATNGGFTLDQAVTIIRQQRGAKEMQRLAEWRESVENPRPVSDMIFASTDVAPATADPTAGDPGGRRSRRRGCSVSSARAPTG